MIAWMVAVHSENGSTRPRLARTFALMGYDEGLAQRVRETLGPRPGISEKKMFGGLCFLLRGNMTCGIRGDELMVRIGPDGWADALAQPHAREMDFTGRSLRGFVYVAAAGIEDDHGLEYWVGRGADFVGSLPPK